MCRSGLFVEMVQAELTVRSWKIWAWSFMDVLCESWRKQVALVGIDNNSSHSIKLNLTKREEMYAPSDFGDADSLHEKEGLLAELHFPLLGQKPRQGSSSADMDSGLPC